MQYLYVIFQERLEEVVENWSQYESVLDRCEAHLSDPVELWVETYRSGSAPEDLQSARQLLQEAKVSKISGYKNNRF